MLLLENSLNTTWFMLGIVCYFVLTVECRTPIGTQIIFSLLQRKSIYGILRRKRNMLWERFTFQLAKESLEIFYPIFETPCSTSWVFTDIYDGNFQIQDVKTYLGITDARSHVTKKPLSL